VTIADLAVQLLVDDRRFKRDVVRSAEDAGSHAGRGMGKRLSAGLGTALKVGTAVAAAGIIALTGALTYGAVKAAKFETAMLNVNSIAKASPADFEAMKTSVLGMSRELPQSAETLAKGLYDIASSGFAGKEGLDVLRASAKAASAGLATTEDSAKGVTAVLNAYGLKAKQAGKVSDVLFKIVDRGVITFPELANVIGTTTALASPLGVSLEEVGAGIAVLTKNGIGAENSVTQLNAIMTSILKPSKEAADLAKDLGVEWNVGALKAKGLTGVLNDMIVATDGSQEEMAVLLGDSRAIRGAFVLAQEGGAEFNAELALMEGAAGATDTALSYQKQGLAFQLGILRNNIDAAAITIGTALIPAITEVVKGVTAWLQANEPMIQQIVGFLVPALGAIIATVGGIIGKIAAWVKSVAESEDGMRLLQTIAGAISSAIRDIGGRIAGVIGWIASFVNEISSNEDAMRILQAIANDIGAAFGSLFTSIQTTIDKVLRIADEIKKNKKTMEDLRFITDRIAGAFNSLFKGIGDSDDALVDIHGEIDTGKEKRARLRDDVRDIANAFGAVVDAIREVIQWLDQLNAWAQSHPLGFVGDWMRARDALIPIPVPGRQHGGRAYRGQAYWVGEQGIPELYVPDETGTILTADEALRAGALGGLSNHIDLTVHLPDGSTRRERVEGGSEVDIWLRNLEQEASVMGA
jgi:TP901 family phage tail tape measure protein